MTLFHAGIQAEKAAAAEAAAASAKAAAAAEAEAKKKAKPPKPNVCRMPQPFEQLLFKNYPKSLLIHPESSTFLLTQDPCPCGNGKKFKKCCGKA